MGDGCIEPAFWSPLAEISLSIRTNELSLLLGGRRVTAGQENPPGHGNPQPWWGQKRSNKLFTKNIQKFLLAPFLGSRNESSAKRDALLI